MTLALAPTPAILPGTAAEIGDAWIDRLIDQWLASLGGESSDALTALGTFVKTHPIG
jgi:hypothetical protein